MAKMALYCYSRLATAAAAMVNPSSPPSLIPSNKNPTPLFFNKSHYVPKLFKIPTIAHRHSNFITSNSSPAFVSETESDYEREEEEYISSYSEDGDDEEQEHGQREDGQASPLPANKRRRRRRYRKQYPGEKKGITEEMRFVAMKLRNNEKNKNGGEIEDKSEETETSSGGSGDDTWQPSMEGFLKYLVDSQLVFSNIERIVEDSTDVSYVYFRKTGLERSDSISKDLEWLREQGNVIPEPSNPGVTYVQYLKELAEKSPPLFLCHFYNIYFSHIAGGQVIAKQVSGKLLEGRELEFYKWEGDAEELLRGVREKLNALGEHWSRDEKNKCLRVSTKAFRYLGQIVRLIIL